MDSKVYVVVEDHLEDGIETFVYNSKEMALKAFDEIIHYYKVDMGGLEDSEVNEHWAIIQNCVGGEIARVFWEEKIVE